MYIGQVSGLVEQKMQAQNHLLQGMLEHMYICMYKTLITYGMQYNLQIFGFGQRAKGRQQPSVS